jgi:NADH:ubiquinone oxidoreductase subunit C
MYTRVSLRERSFRVQLASFIARAIHFLRMPFYQHELLDFFPISYPKYSGQVISCMQKLYSILSGKRIRVDCCASLNMVSKLPGTDQIMADAGASLCLPARVPMK